MRIFLFIAAFLVSFQLPSEESTDKATSSSPPTTNTTISPKRTIISFDHSHSKWTTVLKNFVIQNGAVTEVNYKSLKENSQTFNKYLQSLSAVEKKLFDTWSEKQKMSFWINAYNAFTVKLILDNYPLNSIKDTGGFFSSPWKKEFFQLFGRNFYLDKIEHEILRKNFKEPRIHFAVNCASVGCPALRTEAFTSDQLDQQLQEQAFLFLKDTSRNRVDHKTKSVHVSKIFKWFKEDFGSKDKNIIEFVFPFMKSEGDQLKDWQKYELEFTSYDWQLNGVKN